MEFNMEKLSTYAVYVKVFVLGESEDDALDTVYSAVDMCDLLDQDGVVGIEVVEDADDVSDEVEFSSDDEE